MFCRLLGNRKIVSDRPAATLIGAPGPCEREVLTSETDSTGHASIDPKDGVRSNPSSDWLELYSRSHIIGHIDRQTT